MKTTINNELRQYIETTILPAYETFDKAHGPAHAQKVIAESLALAADYDVDINMVYAIAAYHDVGLARERKLHHIYSGERLLADAELCRWFVPDQLEIMKQAVEDHRASNDYPPRSIYGRIVAEADRDVEPEHIVRRTIQYGLKLNQQADKEWHWQRLLEHMHDKYAEGGYMKLCLHSPKNERNLADMRALIADKKALRQLFEQLFVQETATMA